MWVLYLSHTVIIWCSLSIREPFALSSHCCYNSLMHNDVLRPAEAGCQYGRRSGSWIWYGELMDMGLINDEDKWCHALSSKASQLAAGQARGQRQSFWEPDTIIIKVLLPKHITWALWDEIVITGVQAWN